MPYRLVISHQSNNIFDQDRQIGSVKTHFWGRNTIVFDVWRHVFVMWVCTLEARFIGMWLRIIPVQQISIFPNFIAVPVDDHRQVGIDEPFANDQPIPICKENFSRYSGQRNAVTGDCQCRALNPCKGCGYRIDKKLIVIDGTQCIVHAATRMISDRPIRCVRKRSTSLRYSACRVSHVR